MGFNIGKALKLIGSAVAAYYTGGASLIAQQQYSAQKAAKQAAAEQQNLAVQQQQQQENLRTLQQNLATDLRAGETATVLAGGSADLMDADSALKKKKGATLQQSLGLSL